MAVSDLLLAPAVRDALFAHAREGAADDPPREVCGVLGGRRAGAEPTEGRMAEGPTAADADATDANPADADRHASSSDVATTVERVPNVADRPRTAYELDPAATIDAVESIEADGRDHLGFYHTHPEGPRGPSRTDRARATWPGYVYLIVSLDGDPVVGAWRWTGERFEQLRIDVAEPESESGRVPE